MVSVKPIIGGGLFLSKDNWTPSALKSCLEDLRVRGVTEIDVAQGYGDSEELLGEARAGESFNIATKIPGIMDPGSLRKDQVIQRTQASMKKLNIEQIDILYLHSPDPTIPIEETLSGIQQLFEDGAFRRFGVSNHTAEELQRIYDHQKSKGWVLPAVYQGNYNPLTRSFEKNLFPTLRKLGISFYAYSPTAGGFLAKTKQQIVDGAGRFGKEGGAQGFFYNEMYNKPSMLDALAAWNEIAQDAGVSGYDLATRWVAFSSSLGPAHGDGIVMGASSVPQLGDNLAGLEKGPLPAEIVSRIDMIWDNVSHEAPVVDIPFITSTGMKYASQILAK
ncbi:Oxidoreductase sirO [Colletotrichum sp. SAR 10_98]|nr:Oxidoreductase sirO [Colletotrichum sp. SAR 10_98]